MKASEYLKKFYKVEMPNNSLGSIIIKLFLEIGEIAKKRHAHSDASMVSIVKEQNLKWYAILGRLFLERNNLFVLYVINKLPQMAQHLKRERKIPK